jgi:general secretion pathway protein G
VKTNAHERRRIVSGLKDHRGFTLIEVLIVIAIILALGGLVVVNLLPAKGQADIDLQRAQFDSIDKAMALFKLHLGRYPTDDEGLAALMHKDALQDETEQSQWRGPYLESDASKDKWNHAIVYHIPSEALGEGYYDLISFGPDGQEGTGDDITNHDRLKNANGEIESPAGKGADTFAPPPSAGSGAVSGK